MKRLFQVLALTLFTMTSAIAAQPINTLERSGLWGYKHNGIAIRGFDTVAYFTEGKPMEGSEKFASDWKGAKWLFANQAHLDLFEADPEKYAPQYGGYCAYGIAVDNLVKIEGNLWDIVDGKLYLNFDKKFQNKWRADIEGYIKSADKKFDGLLENSK